MVMKKIKNVIYIHIFLCFTKWCYVRQILKSLDQTQNFSPSLVVVKFFLLNENSFVSFFNKKNSEQWHSNDLLNVNQYCFFPFQWINNIFLRYNRQFSNNKMIHQFVISSIMMRMKWLLKDELIQLFSQLEKNILFLFNLILKHNFCSFVLLFKTWSPYHLFL